MPIKQYDPIIAILRSQLLTNTELASFIGTWSSNGYTGHAVYPQYINSVQNPVFPALTICQEYNLTLKNRTGYEQSRYYIHGWVKPGQDPAPDDAAYLHNLVVSILDVNPLTGFQVPEFAVCRKLDGRCPLYDKETRTTYFMTEWLIYASKSLINT